MTTFLVSRGPKHVKVEDSQEEQEGWIETKHKKGRKRREKQKVKEKLSTFSADLASE